DQVLAATSHLPHILAFTMMNHLHHSTSNPENLLRFAGSGFRDFTRIASSSPEMWRDICLANREALLEQIDAYQNELKALQEMLKNNDGGALEKSFSQARSVRENWLKNKD
ncbi:MAG: prephenate dehydrogenase, partial [Nitrosomonas sp.]|uniref:prephenate dehydrogenase n=1 Tax=Nitrosomonas sp. TaxID=42353 RepID=UPI00273508A1